MASNLPMDNPEISSPGPEMLDDGEALPPKLLSSDPFYMDLAEQILTDPDYIQLEEQMENVYSALCKDRLAQFDESCYLPVVKQFKDNRRISANYKRFREALMQDPSIPGKRMKLTEDPPCHTIVIGETEIEFCRPKIRETVRETWLRWVGYLRRMIPSDNTTSVDIPGPNKSEESRSEHDTFVLYEASVEHVEGSVSSLLFYMVDSLSLNAMVSGADINKLDKVGRTALHRACALGKVKKAEFLIDNGVDMGIPDNQGNTALHYAAGYGKEQCVELLIKRGADVTLKNSFGDTTYGIAEFNNQTHVMKLLIENGVMNLLNEKDV